MFILMHPSLTSRSSFLKNLESNTDFLSFLQKIIEFSQKSENPAKCKGDLFEIFVEYFLQLNGKDYGIFNYIPTSERNDWGVDGSARNFLDDTLTVQAKFRSDSDAILSIESDLYTFLNSSKRYYNIIDNSNLLVISTTKTLNDKHPNMRFIGIDELISKTSNINFWSGFYSCWSKSVKNKQIRPKYQLYPYQNRVLSKIDQFKNNSPETCAQFILPTGSGKTLLEIEAANITIESGGKYILVITNGIALTHQLLLEFWKFKTKKYKQICVCSEKIIELPNYEKEEPESLIVPTTTEASVITDVIIKNTESALMFFSTYDSAPKIASAFKELGLNIDICIADEAHNLCDQNNFEILFDGLQSLPTKKWAFFTATRKIDFTNSFGKGMNNFEKFGLVNSEIKPAELIEMGHILSPRITILNIDKDLGEQNEIDACFIKEGVRITRELVLNGLKKNHKIIVPCRSVANAHDFAESFDLNKELSEIGNYITDAISSDPTRMKDSKKETKLNYFRNENTSNVLYHFDMISEGINVESIDTVIILRKLGGIKTIQMVGRAGRPMPEDRQNLKIGKIVTGIHYGWIKPNSHIVLCVLKQNELDFETIAEMIRSIRDYGYNCDAEGINFIDISEGSGNPKDDEKNHENETNSLILTKERVFEIIENMKRTTEKVEATYVMRHLSDKKGFLPPSNNHNDLFS